MWITGNFRRIFLDMHIDDSNEEFLSKLEPEKIVSTLKKAGAQTVVVKGKPHTGLCYWPCSIGRMHRGLNGRDYVGEMISLCHENCIDVIVYYSQIFDNWAYENYPAWRCVFFDGLNSKERSHLSFQKGRYGLVCPNNMEYRQYIKTNLQELASNYTYEGMFMDMPFWSEICYCHSCKERYLKETGREMPKVINWKDRNWLEFQSIREKWMGEFVAFSTRCVKDVNPNTTIEHNYSVALFSWQSASTDFIVDASDYAGGDYFGGYVEQSFICKYYKNISPNLPFSYITSRCDPNLTYHTTTKTEEELLLQAITALVHNGAFSICDGINPDGTIVTEAYDDVIKKVFDEISRYEKYVNGQLMSNVSIWFATHSKFGLYNDEKYIGECRLDKENFTLGKVKMASILRASNIPFEIVASRNLHDIEDDVLIISDVIFIRDDEMSAIEEYVMSGGNLYISGHVGHERLFELLEVNYLGKTEHTFTYMNPTEEGAKFFEGCNRISLLAIEESQHLIEIEGQCDILATITLPYTMTDTEQFVSIHSNPPGIHTDFPAILMKKVGKGKIMWLAAPIEATHSHLNRRVVHNLLRSLCNELKFTSNAPSFVEIIGWKKDDKLYLAAINQQETVPIWPVYDVYISLPGRIRSARLLGKDSRLDIESDSEGSRIKLPPISLFHMIEVEC